jgi:hypothetical protein
MFVAANLHTHFPCYSYGEYFWRIFYGPTLINVARLCLIHLFKQVKFAEYAGLLQRGYLHFRGSKPAYSFPMLTLWGINKTLYLAHFSKYLNKT